MLYRAERATHASILDGISQSNTARTRPSMRGKLEQIRVMRSRSTTVESDKIQVHNIPLYETTVQFPHSMSIFCKKMCYLFTYHPHLDVEHISHGFIPFDVLHRVKTYSPCIPDIISLVECLNALTWCQSPFEELHSFKDLVWKVITQTHKSQLSWTRLFQLYVASYLGQSMWNQAWIALFPIMSPQLSKEVLKFVETHEFDSLSFMQSLHNR